MTNPVEFCSDSEDFISAVALSPSVPCRSLYAYQRMLRRGARRKKGRRGAWAK